MTVSYVGLWKLLLEKGLQKQDLVEKAGLSSATVAKMGKGEPVSNKVLEKEALHYCIKPLLKTFLNYFLFDSSNLAHTPALTRIDLTVLVG